MTNMTLSEEERNAYQVNAIELRTESFRNILLITTIVGWLWFSWAAWPRSRVYALFYSDAWSISLLLLGLVLLCFLVQRRHVYTAISLFIGGLVLILTGMLELSETPDSAYLFVIPVVFSSVLQGQISLFLTTALVNSMMVGISILNPTLRFADFVPALVTILLTATAISSSTRNLHIALAWTLNGYRHAHKNELLARERKTQLEQALTRLDRAMAGIQRANSRLLQISAEAEEARRLKQQFAQTISHELRTPLNLIAGFAETMIKSPEYYGGALPPNYLRDLSVVYRNACHLQDLVSDVLDLARLEAAYLSLQIEELDFAALIHDAINMARALVESRGLTLRTDIAPDLPPVVGDAVRLKQVILNLLKNAVRFTERGSVTVRAWAEDDVVVVAVNDTGIGIPADSLTHIFEAFRQVENSMQRRTEGAGLGLSISQQLITLHGGKIWVESEVGTGSTFFFSVPIKQVETLTLERTIEPDLAHAIQATPQQKPLALILTRNTAAAAPVSRALLVYRVICITDPAQMPPIVERLLPDVVIVDTHTITLDQGLPAFVRQLQDTNTLVISCPLPGNIPIPPQAAADNYLIKPITSQDLWDTIHQFDDDFENVLIVEDDRDFARLVSRMLNNPVQRYAITYAYSGHEALQLAEHAPPDLILLNLNLPDMDGRQVIERLRAQPAFDATRIVVITAHEDTESAQLLQGELTVTKTTGLRPSELLRWLRVLSSARHNTPTLPVDSGPAAEIV
jgi:signal transduction histidine kinase/CheY-like chemotaxis protein